jgi:hypothetical protein
MKIFGQDIGYKLANASAGETTAMSFRMWMILFQVIII